VCGVFAECLESDSPDFHNLLKAILRYYYDEVQYNHHFGGDDFSGFMQESGFIFTKDFFDNLNQDQAEELDSDLCSMECYDDNGISIYAGYFDGEYNMPLYSIINTEDHLFDTLSKKLETQNYHDFESDVRRVISGFNRSFAKIVEFSSIVYRARTGVESIKIAHEAFNRSGRKIYVPYKEDQISSVPPLKATNGRANRTGVSYLYCATDEYTALAEIRPHPTDVVSVGKFSINRALKIFDFNEPDFIDFYENEGALVLMVAYAKMASFYNTATPPSLEGRYLVTQLISECIRMEGYDGIKFKSTVGDGVNLVLFKAGDASYIGDSAKVYEVEKVDYLYKQKPVVGQGDEYETYLD